MKVAALLVFIFAEIGCAASQPPVDSSTPASVESPTVATVDSAAAASDERQASASTESPAKVAVESAADERPLERRLVELAETTQDAKILDLALATQRITAENEALKAKIADRERKDAQEVLKFLEYGVTVGAAFAVQMHIASTRTSDFDIAAAGKPAAMPYLAVLPAYFRPRPSQRKYCASVSTGTEQRAQVAADDVAREEAGEFANLLIAAFATPGTDAERTRTLESVVGAAFLPGRGSSDTEVQRIVSLVKLHFATGTSPSQQKNARMVLVHAISATPLVGWAIGAPAGCGWYKLGAYIGKPADYDMTCRYRGAQQGTIEVTPNALCWVDLRTQRIVSLLAGYTFASEDVKTSGLNPIADTITLHQVTFAIGLNADMLRLFVK